MAQEWVTKILTDLEESSKENKRVRYAFWMGLTKGEAARDKAILPDNPDPANEMFWFEVGLQLGPKMKEYAASADAALKQAAAEFAKNVLPVIAKAAAEAFIIWVMAAIGKKP